MDVIGYIVYKMYALCFINTYDTCNVRYSIGIKANKQIYIYIYIHICIYPNWAAMALCEPVSWSVRPGPFGRSFASLKTEAGEWFPS